MSLQPLGDRIVVRPGEAEETTVSGLVIPDTAKEKPQQGEVLAVGPGRRSEQPGELIPRPPGASAGNPAPWADVPQDQRVLSLHDVRERCADLPPPLPGPPLQP